MKQMKRKTWVSPKKLDSLPEGTRVKFEGSTLSNDRWTKRRGMWIVVGQGLPFSSKTLCHYQCGCPFYIIEDEDASK